MTIPSGRATINARERGEKEVILLRESKRFIDEGRGRSGGGRERGRRRREREKEEKVEEGRLKGGERGKEIAGAEKAKGRVGRLSRRVYEWMTL